VPQSGNLALAFSSESLPPGLDPGWMPFARARRARTDAVRVQRKLPLMSKPAKTEAELVAMARVELKAHADCPDGIDISVLRADDSWEFRASADEATAAKPGYPECVAMLVQIGDHLSRQYDVKG
jgi:hypothetical protein